MPGCHLTWNCKMNQQDANTREETITDGKAHFIHTKESPEMKTLTILDQCDYVYMHIGLSVRMNRRAIVTNSWVFEMKG